MPLLSFHFGITWDEAANREYSKDMLNYFLSLGQDRSVFNTNKHLYDHLIYYSNSFGLVTAFIYKFLSPLGAFETRHVLNALTGAITIILTGLTGKELKGWRLACLTILFMLIFPRFFGHSMNNPKDIPFAAGYMAGLYGIIRFFKVFPYYHKATTIAGLILALALPVSVRVIGIILPAYWLLFLFFHWIRFFYKDREEAIGLLPRYVKWAVIIPSASFFLGILCWPYGLESPFLHTYEAVTALSDWGKITLYELFDGKLIFNQNPPWYYLPKYILITTPVFILAGGVLFLIFFYRLRHQYHLMSLLIILTALLFPVVWAIVNNTTLFNGWRHFMFVAPLISLTGAIGWELLFTPGTRKVQLIAAGILLILCGNTAIWMIRYHPNEYIYFNEIAGGVKGAYGNYETDTYGNVVRQGVEWLFEHKAIPDKDSVLIGTNNQKKTAQYYVRKYADSIRVTWTEHDYKYEKPWNYALFTSRRMSRTALKKGAFPPPGTVHTITVKGAPILAIVKRPPQKPFQKGYQALANKQFKKATHHFKKAVKYAPQLEEGVRILGFSYLKNGNLFKARECMQKALKLRDNNYLGHQYLGIIAYKQQDLEKAKVHFKKAIQYKSNMSSAYFYLANVYARQQKYNKARKHYQQALKHQPQNRSAVLTNYAQTLLYQTTQTNAEKEQLMQKAIKVLEQAIKLNPDNQHAYKNLIRAYRMAGKERQAAIYQKKLNEISGSRNGKSLK